MPLQQFQDIEIANCLKDNSIIIRCPFDKCNARIIVLSKQYLANEITIQNSPEMVQLTGTSDDQTHFFKVNDVWDFDNIGVSRPADGLSQPTVEEGENMNLRVERLLICSECDKGPIGFAGFQDGNNDVKNLKYFLSCNSVLYDVK